MRQPSDMPAPRRRIRRPGRGRVVLIVAAIAIFLLLTSLRGIARVYTDYLWFDSLGQGSTWSSLLAARVAPALVFTVVFFVIMFVNLVIADRLAPKYRAMGPEDELIARYQLDEHPDVARVRRRQPAPRAIGDLAANVAVDDLGVDVIEQRLQFDNHLRVVVGDVDFRLVVGERLDLVADRAHRVDVLTGGVVGLVAIVWVIQVWRWPPPGGPTNFSPPSTRAVDVTGRWTARVKYDWGDEYDEVFEFKYLGDALHGTATYQTGRLTIEQAKLKADWISFVTRSQEMLGSNAPWKEVTHRYTGQVAPDAIRFTMESSGGYSIHPPVEFTAQRVPKP